MDDLHNRHAESGVTYTALSQDAVAEVALRARRRLLDLALTRGVHLGSSLSVIDILVCAYATLRIDPLRTNGPRDDVLLLSKGHAVWGLYSVLFALGVPGLDDPRAGHPMDGAPGVVAGSGALGHGLSIGAGLAEAARLDGSRRRTLVVLGDGELDEGSVWEAVMFAAHRELGNLAAVVDRNGLQQEGATETILALEPLAAKWRAFGWDVVEVDGHDYPELLSSLRTALAQRSKPCVVLARTVKGRGVRFMENETAWHYGQLEHDQWKRALSELSPATVGAVRCLG